jgi:ABC-2 type transport system ATP-binding protein
MNNILSFKSVIKEFSNVKAVNDLSFSVNRGEIFALLGPNGAGKTTSVRMIMNIIKPDSGQIRFHNPKGEEFLPHPEYLGYLPEERGLYQEVPIIKTLIYMGVIRGMDKKEARIAAEKWLEKLDLKDRLKEKLSTLSKGNQQKVQFISAIIHTPELAILDEPFSGFDPVNQELFLDIIKDFKAGGTTILLCAHQMHLVERIADNIVLLNKGEKITEGTVDEIRREHPENGNIIFYLKEKPDLSKLKAIESVEHAEIIGVNQIKIVLKKGESLSVLLITMASLYDIADIKTERIDLHEIFLRKVSNHDGGSNGK